jgi:hypothetical protein
MSGPDADQLMELLNWITWSYIDTDYMSKADYEQAIQACSMSTRTSRASGTARHEKPLTERASTDYVPGVSTVAVTTNSASNNPSKSRLSSLLRLFC